jgi:hypothetical protein
MIPESQILVRLYHNRELLLEAERDRLFRISSSWEPSSTLIRRELAYLDKAFIWLGNRLEAQYDGYHLDTADQPC